MIGGSVSKVQLGQDFLRSSWSYAIYIDIGTVNTDMLLQAVNNANSLVKFST